MKSITEIQMKSAPDSKKLKRLTPKEVLYEGSREIQLPQAGAAYGKLLCIWGLTGMLTILSTAGEAISLAYEISGTVTGESGAYVWRKVKIQYQEPDYGH